MDKCVALIGIVVENYNSVDNLNNILHDNRNAIIGRLGIPHKERKLSIMSIVVDTDSSQVDKMVAAIGKLDGVKVNVIIS